eukprot:jgi/Galph1/2096/GphlegSOOS_G825.1
MSPTEIALKYIRLENTECNSILLHLFYGLGFSIFNDFIEEVSDEMNFQKENENNRKLADCFQSNSRMVYLKYTSICALQRF